MSEIRIFRYSGNVDDAFKGIIVVLLSFCLAQQAQAGSISISNRNCALQGLSRTNHTKFFLFASAGTHGEDKPPNVPFDNDCTSRMVHPARGVHQNATGGVVDTV